MPAQGNALWLEWPRHIEPCKGATIAKQPGVETMPQSLPDVKKYIERQADHHHRMTFQDELRQLLARHGMTVDERYLWS